MINICNKQYDENESLKIIQFYKNYHKNKLIPQELWKGDILFNIMVNADMNTLRLVRSVNKNTNKIYNDMYLWKVKFDKDFSQHVCDDGNYMKKYVNICMAREAAHIFTKICDNGIISVINIDARKIHWLPQRLFNPAYKNEYYCEKFIHVWFSRSQSRVWKHTMFDWGIAVDTMYTGICGDKPFIKNVVFRLFCEYPNIILERDNGIHKSLVLNKNMVINNVIQKGFTYV